MKINDVQQDESEMMIDAVTNNLNCSYTKSPAFREIVDFYLLKCPVRVYTRVKKSKEEKENSYRQSSPKYNYYFSKVSRQDKG